MRMLSVGYHPPRGTRWRSGRRRKNRRPFAVVGSESTVMTIPIMGRKIPNMGREDCLETLKPDNSQPARKRNELPSLGLAEGLFSRVQLRVLALLFGQPERGFQGAVSRSCSETFPCSRCSMCSTTCRLFFDPGPSSIEPSGSALPFSDSISYLIHTVTFDSGGRP